MIELWRVHEDDAMDDLPSRGPRDASIDHDHSGCRPKTVQTYHGIRRPSAGAPEACQRLPPPDVNSFFPTWGEGTFKIFARRVRPTLQRTFLIRCICGNAQSRGLISQGFVVTGHRPRACHAYQASHEPLGCSQASNEFLG